LPPGPRPPGCVRADQWDSARASYELGVQSDGGEGAAPAVLATCAAVRAATRDGGDVRAGHPRSTGHPDAGQGAWLRVQIPTVGASASGGAGKIGPLACGNTRGIAVT